MRCIPLRHHYYFITSSNINLTETINTTLLGLGIPEKLPQEDNIEIRENHLSSVAGYSFSVFTIEQEVIEGILWELLPYNPASIDNDLFFALRELLAPQGVLGPLKYSEVVFEYPSLIGVIPAHQIAGDPDISLMIDW